MFDRDYGRGRALWLGGEDPQMVNSVQRNEPPAYQLPYLQFGLQEASRQYGDPRSRVGGFSPESSLALNLGRERAMLGSPLMGQAQGELGKTLGGDYLRAGNPYLGAVTQSVSDQVTPQIQSRFTQAGGSGASAEPAMIAREIANAISPYAFGSYESERGRQMQAQTMAPGVAANDYLDIAQLSNVGSQYDAQNQRRLTEPDELLNQYLRQITGSFQGSTQTNSQPYFSNPTANVLGLGLGGLSAATMLRTLGVL